LVLSVRQPTAAGWHFGTIFPTPPHSAWCLEFGSHCHTVSTRWPSQFATTVAYCCTGVGVFEYDEVDCNGSETES